MDRSEGAPARRRRALALVVASLLGGLTVGLAPAPTSAEEADPVEQWVTLVYRTCVHRDPDPGGLAYWTDRYDTFYAEGSPQVIAWFICFASESLDPTVVDAYRWILDRDPSATDVAYWREWVRGHRNLLRVERRLLASAERVARSGGTPEGYVQDLYTRLLGRAATPDDIAYWTARLAHGGSRAHTVGALYGSAEGRRARVTGLAADILGTAPTPAQLGDGDYLLRVFGDARLVAVSLLQDVAPTDP